MANLSIYLFWTGMVTAILASLLYVAFTASAAFSVRRLAAVTDAGTITLPTSTGTPNMSLGHMATTLTIFTVMALGGAVATRWSAVGHPPMSNMYEFTVAFGFAISAAYLVFERTSHQRRFGTIALPLVIAILFIATLFPSRIVPLIPALQNGRLLAIHVSTMMISYAVLTVAFSGALMYLIQGGRGRRRFASLPSAEASEEFATRAMMVGTPLLGLGIALGAWWANDAWGRYWGWDPKETAAAVTFLSCSAFFHARAGTGSVAGAAGIRKFVPQSIIRGWRPDPMWWIVLSYGLVLFTYFVVNLWVSGLHSYAGV